MTKKKQRIAKSSSRSIEPAPAPANPPAVQALPMENRYMKPTEAAAYLGVSLGTLAHWRSEGGKRYRPELKFKRCGSLVRYELSDLKAFNTPLRRRRSG